MTGGWKRRMAAAGAIGLALSSPALPGRPKAEPLVQAGDLAPAPVNPAVARFYQARGFAPHWVGQGEPNPAARLLVARRSEARKHGLEPDAIDTRGARTALAAATNRDPAVRACAELALSAAFVRFATAVARPAERNAMRYVDQGLRPRPPEPTELLTAASDAADRTVYVAAVDGLNPVYAGLTRDLGRYRSEWGTLPQTPLRPGDRPALARRLGLPGGAGERQLASRLRRFQAVHALPATGWPDAATLAALNRGAAHYIRLIEANRERARALPLHPSGRYLIVDTASAQLWMVENGRIADRMKAVVGKPGMATPVMAGNIRFAAWNPYWILPPDLIRERARRVLRQGPRALTAENIEILSDWSPGARRLNPAQVDWRALAAGRKWVQLRQRPGTGNMMGRVKFMLPNDLGIYLHDTNNHDLFKGAERRHSSGCVRVEDAMRLARWLYRGRLPERSGAPEERIDLPEPVPVYIAYFTALPSADGVVFQPDVYGRDRA